MGEFFDVSTVAKRVRLFGTLEAFSWALLLTGSVLKRLPEPITWPVMVFGLLHGLLFLLFVLNVFLASREFSGRARRSCSACSPRSFRSPRPGSSGGRSRAANWAN